MSTEKALEKALKKEQKKRRGDKDFQEKSDLIADLKEKGLLVPQKYGIAPLDTVGRRRYMNLK